MSTTEYAQLLAAREVVVVCGPGGVGKTTVAAASGVLAAQRHGGRVLVLTVDPARRLATALGLDSLGTQATRIEPARLRRGREEPLGELWVAQLDTRQAWDQLIERHAPDAETRDAILANSLYENVTGKFVHSHDYVAMEQLFDLHASGEWDLIVIDTPPSRNAIDFLEAPARMEEFFGSRILRWLTVPYRSRLFSAASKPFYMVADRILGQQFLREVADFFLLFQTMHKGFVERAGQVQRVLRSTRTAFVVVSTPEAGSVAECRYFIDALGARDLHLGGVVLNRVLPSFLSNRRAATAARTIARDAETLAAEVLDGHDPVVAARVLEEVSQRFLDFSVAAVRQGELQDELDATAPTITVPYITDDLVDVDGLAIVAAALDGV